MGDRLHLYGGFAKNWSHNRQLVKILRCNYALVDLSQEDRGSIGFSGFLKYFINNFKKAKSMPPNSVCFVGFNSLYDVVLLRLVSVFFLKKYKIVNEMLVLQYDTYILNKPISINKYKLHYYKFFLYCLDYLTLHFSDIVIFDTNANLDRFSKAYRLRKNKCKVCLLCANNDFFLKNKKESFWRSKKLNILWYGNPSKLHNLDFIKNIFKKLDKKKFNLRLVDNMGEISLRQISELLEESHISLGCFGGTDKCKNVVINKEYEALASNTLLITKAGNKEFLDGCAIFCESEQEVVDIINYFYLNRDKLLEQSNQASQEYARYCSFGKLSENYTSSINSIL